MKNNPSGCEGSILIGMGHGHNEAFGAVHEYVVVHLSIAGFEYVEDVFRVGRVDYPAEREEGEYFCCAA